VRLELVGRITENQNGPSSNPH